MSIILYNVYCKKYWLFYFHDWKIDMTERAGM